MEGRPPPDLEPQNQQEEEEVCDVFKFGIRRGFCFLLPVLLLEKKITHVIQLSP